MGIVQDYLEDLSVMKTIPTCQNVVVFFFNSGSELSTEFLRSSDRSPASFKKRWSKSPLCKAQGNAGVLWTASERET